MRDYVRTYCHLGGGKLEDFYETAADDAKRFADLAQQAVADGFTAFKSDGRAADDAARRAQADPRGRSMRGRDARGGRRRHRHHGRLPRPPVAGDGAASSPRRSNRTGCTSSKSRAGRRASTAWRRSTRRVTHADRHGRAGDAISRRFAICSPPGPARSASSTSRTAAASPKPGASRPWPRRTASPWRRTIRKDRSARRRRWSSASRSRATSSAKRCMPTCPGGKTWCRKASRSSRRAASCARTHGRAGHQDQRSGSEEASVPAGDCRSACFTPTAAWAIGKPCPVYCKACCRSSTRLSTSATRSTRKASAANVDWAFAQGIGGIGTGMVSELSRSRVTSECTCRVAGRVRRRTRSRCSRQSVRRARGKLWHSLCSRERRVRRDHGHPADEQSLHGDGSASITSAPSPTASTFR